MSANRNEKVSRPRLSNNTLENRNLVSSLYLDFYGNEAKATIQISSIETGELKKNKTSTYGEGIKAKPDYPNIARVQSNGKIDMPKGITKNAKDKISYRLFTSGVNSSTEINQQDNMHATVDYSENFGRNTDIPLGKASDASVSRGAGSTGMKEEKTNPLIRPMARQQEGGGNEYHGSDQGFSNFNHENNGYSDHYNGSLDNAAINHSEEDQSSGTFDPQLLSSGGIEDPDSPGTWRIEDPIAVGTIFTIGANTGGTAQGTLNTWTWGGGTDFRSYPLSSVDPSQPAPAPVKVVTGVPTDSWYYEFIIDAEPRTYTISFSGVTDLGETGSATLTFTSVKPTASISDTFIGTQDIGFFDDNGDPAQPFAPGTTRMGPYLSLVSMEATTYTPYYQVEGQFMFVQTTNFTHTSLDAATSANPSPTTKTRQSHDRDQDSGFDNSSSPFTLGLQPITPDPFDGYYYYGSWNSYASTNVLHTTVEDQPILAFPASVQSASTGTWKFYTYLMYRPNPGNSVWIALDKAEWKWGMSYAITATSPFLTKTVIQTPDIQVVGPPSGEDAFPEWQGLTSNLTYQ